MEQRTENSEAQMRKGVLELCVLALVAEQEFYPSEIIAKLKDSKVIVVEGTLYPLLTRLKNDAMLTYRWVESNSGPPRKYYKLTDKGKIYLTTLRTSWNQLCDSVNQIINMEKKNE
jgi:PadR family transcriptional regulator PadR